MEKLAELLQKLAEQVGQTVESLWPHAVRYVAVQHGVKALGALFGFAVCVLFIRKCWAHAATLPEWVTRGVYSCGTYQVENEVRQIWVWVPAVVGGVGGLVSAITFFSVLPPVFEPVGFLVVSILGGAK